MKVLFVASGNSASGVSPIVKAQAASLIAQGVELLLFTIKGKGLKGYLSNIRSLKKTISHFSPDVIHAHYSLTAFVTTLASKKPVVVSLMGSDVKSSNKFKPLVRLFSKYVWGATIVKTEDMRESIRLKNAIVIPNGVDIAVFKPLSKRACREQLGLVQNKTYILFAANPNRPEKNFELAKQAVEKLEQPAIELIWLENVSHSDIPVWMNAADVVVLASLWEGSPNVIKEAMACNCPIVSTDVGDVRWLFGNMDGHYLSSFDVSEVAQKLKLALQFAEQKNLTKGRERIMELGLNAESIAKRLISNYKETSHTNE
jgi:glycosyltransferase involved in cell wall biosynthesis